ncbi:hypothetical protein ST47_g8170 [Ascochyta rabiei]|uniref:Uncharacterized protein n=2 Tax=Didymella rabiei TaxID=5454 RepID=A0A162ZL29_DIDRA|nr:hypothetical protein ST47_g8170 [Ascochyta rabiei]
MGKFSAPAASSVKMGNFSSTPSTVARNRVLESCWRKPESSPLPPTATPLCPTSISSSPHSNPFLITRPKPAENCPWDAFGAARLSGLQAPKRAGATQPLECVVGRVVLLPGQQLIPTTSVVHRQAQGKPWEHPQVITKTWVDGNGVRLVKLRTCTSFGGEGITRKKEHQRHYFVEAEESQLTRESDTFTKQTYVNCSPGAEFTAEFEHLALWPGSAKNAIQFSPAAVVGFNKCEDERRDSCN